MLAKASNRSIEKTEETARHTEVSRSKDFYNCTLLCIKVSHQTDWVYKRAREIGIWNVAFLRTMFHGFQKNKTRLSVANFSHNFENNHMLLLSKQDWRCRHLPLWFNASCPFPLDWLRKKENQKCLNELNRILIFPNSLDRFSFRFYISFRLFSRSLDFLKNRAPYEGLGLSVLFLMIAAENVLLDREAEKRARLSCLITKFGTPPYISKKLVYKTINNCYRWRSDFVHSGADKFPEYDEDFKPGQTQKDLELLREVIARILLNYTEYLKFMKMRVKKYYAKTNNKDKKLIEREWFKYIEKCWEDSLST